MNIYIIIFIIVAFLLFSDQIKAALGGLWFITGGAWVELLRGNNASTGNGAGMMGTLILIVICGIHVLLALGFGLGLLIWWLFL
jgi:hypothetical protein